MTIRRREFDLNWISKYRNELFGIAILMIILFHFGEDYYLAVSKGVVDSSQYPVKSVLITGYHYYVGSIGVELFVFLSGMGLYFSYSKNSNVKQFYSKRFKRILIPYLIVAVIFWAVKDFYFLNEPFSVYVADVLFYTFFSRGTKTIWFIGLMIAMYLLFPILYKLIYGGKDKVMWFLILMMIAYSVPVVIACIDSELYSHTQIAATRTPLFVLGCFMGSYIKEGRKISALPAAVFAGLTIVLVFGYTMSDLSFPSYFSRYVDGFYGCGVLIVLTVLLHSIRKADFFNRILRFCGNYSLELYMTHVTLRSLMKSAGFDAYRIGQYLIMIAIAVIVSVGLNRLSGFLQRIVFERRKKQA